MSFSFFFLMLRLPPRSTRTDTLFPYTTLFRSASPDSGRNSPTDIRLLFTIAAESARCRTGGPPDAILGSGQIFESEGARAPVVRSTGRLVFAGAAYGCPEQGEGPIGSRRGHWTGLFMFQVSVVIPVWNGEIGRTACRKRGEQSGEVQ